MKAAKKAVVAVRKSLQGPWNGTFALHPHGEEEQVMRSEAAHSTSPRAVKSAAGDAPMDGTAPSRGRFINSGNGRTLQPIDIGHSDYVALIDPDTAFWSLVEKGQVGRVLSGSRLLRDYGRKAKAFAAEMQKLRFGLKPSAVYFNPTERCNLDCRYCYIPREMRRNGKHMSRERLLDALARLDRHFAATLPRDAQPQIIFHGAEPLLNRDAVFAGIESYRDRFLFGVQTNATTLDEGHHPPRQDRAGGPVRRRRRGTDGAVFPAGHRDLLVRLGRGHAGCERHRPAAVVGGGPRPPSWPCCTWNPSATRAGSPGPRATAERQTPHPDRARRAFGSGPACHRLAHRSGGRAADHPAGAVRPGGHHRHHQLRRAA